MKTIFYLSAILFIITIALSNFFFPLVLGITSIFLFFLTLFFAFLWRNENGKSDLKKIENDLSSLQKEILEISKMDNKVEAIIRLFKVISPIQDKGGFSQTICKLKKKNYGQLDHIISALEVLQSHFRNAGRSEYGINRTKVNEEVTSAKVFLGDVFGIWTKPASYWLENKVKLENEKHHDASKDPNNPVSIWYLINDCQAGGFVKSHTDGILEQISILKKVA